MEKDATNRGGNAPRPARRPAGRAALARASPTLRRRYSLLMTAMERILAEDGPRWHGRRPRGVSLVRVLSSDEAERARAARRGVIISIRAPGMEPPELSGGWKSVLSLEIEDVDLYGNLDPGVVVHGPAAAIAAFARTHRRAPQILIHCHAGVSRSRSVAAAICEAFGWPYHWTVLHRPLYDAVLANLGAARAER